MNDIMRQQKTGQYSLNHPVDHANLSPLKQTVKVISYNLPTTGTLLCWLGYSMAMLNDCTLPPSISSPDSIKSSVLLL